MKRLFVISTLALGACTANAGHPNPTPPARADMQLAIYDVPQGTARDLRNSLNFALQGEGSGKESAEAAFGRASLAPDGRLVVLAPEAIQRGVAALADQASKKPSAIPARTDLTYWFVLGKRSAGSAPGEAQVPAGLAEIKPALDEIMNAQGPMHFRQLEQLRLSTISGDHGDVTGKEAWVRQDLTVHGGVVLARLGLRLGSKSLDTTVQLKPGQLMVLGQSGWRNSEGKEDEEQTLFYVIRADVHDAGATKP
ncbi:MAG: hypothetical protein HY901_20170 [Deltaproteobacteria bacterium]|nr:hypothetical protein [Deltaproteobacteria bacterium]